MQTERPSAVYVYPPDDSFFTGHEIPFSWTELKHKIRSHDYAGLAVGDYKPITLSTGETLLMELAGINTYVGYGDEPLGAHLDFISRDCLTQRYRYNSTDTNSGGYICSELNMFLQTKLLPQLPAEVQDVIVSKRGLVETKLEAYATNWNWQELGKLWLPSEIELWGFPTFCERPWGQGLGVQYPIFQGSTLHKIKRLGIGGDRWNWWILNTAHGDKARFCHGGRFGLPYRNPATKEYGVPICFRIA